MEVVIHEAVSVEDKVVDTYGILKPFQKSSTVSIVKKNILFGISSCDDMVEGSWIENTKGSGHMGIVYQKARSPT
jgi:hypothetical protein